MPNYFYTDANGTKQGPVNDQQLQSLVTQKIIVSDTPLETESGHKGLAGQIPSLIFPVSTPTQTPTPSPFQLSPQDTPQAVGGTFCTYCGQPVASQAVACMSCGAKPTDHKNYCRGCGVALNPHQVVCIKCGVGIGGAGRRNSPSSPGGSSGGFGNWPMNRIPAALLGILLGGLGIQKYYLGSWGWGLIFTIAAIITGGLLGIVTGVIGIVDGIRYLMMTDDEFTAKYSPETQSPFRW